MENDRANLDKLARALGERDAAIRREEALKAEVERLKAENERYEARLFELGAMKIAPCFKCGYHGEGYYQPQTHPCAMRHHQFCKT